ncbi:conserved repeat domain-containing protein [Pseudoxanthomonas sp. GM95]|uniref:DUF11 domain-containing protein n=1 Tax=Pseudoxanthomonas sp. GM95 TaxID=1881043 RepID=UPI0008D8C9A6|nr:DUF11 domain-containing protein [Pseudoxanthomonas sp. GM95]SEM14873.1 conserved repeat domain-containing protein [Pseudoxanthomonas sp. GM95]
MVLLLCVSLFGYSASAQTGCTAGACMSAGPRLVSVNSSQGPLLNLLFQTLLPGTSVNVSALDWNALAQSDVNLNALITQLGTNLGVSDTGQILNTQVTLAQLRAAMVQVAQADGDTAQVNALNALAPAIDGLTGRVRLGDLVQVNLPQGSLADVKLDTLDLVTGAVQLYNFSNVVTTPQPVTVNTAALGLTGLASLQVWAQVVEPPTYVCGASGASFHTGAIRLKLNAEAVNNFNLAPLIAAINALGVTNTTLTASVLKVQAYADIARAEGTLTAVDGVANAVSFTGRPGLVNLYIGTIPDATFFNRNQVITNALVTPTTLTSLNLQFQLNLLGIGLVTAQVPLAVNVRAAATGSPGLQSFTVTGPFPQTRTASSGTVSAGTLITDLLANLTLAVQAGTISASVLGVPIVVPSAVVTLVNSVVSTTTTLLGQQVGPLLTPILNTLLGGLVDNVLSLLGIKIGQAVFTVEGIARACAAVLSLQKVLAPTTDAGRFNLSISTGGSVVSSVNNVGNGGTTTPFVSTPGSSYSLAEVASSGTTLARYTSTWVCTDQDNNQVATGTGNQFDYTAPALANKQTTVICRITNSARLANLSVTKSDAATTYTPGGSSNYTITVSNAGPAGITAATVNDTLPNGATLSAPWTCATTGGGTCAASGGSAGTSTIAVSVDLPSGAQAVINVPVSFSADPAAY